jgi:kexin
MSLNYGYQENHLYSCSWGPEDDGTHIEGPSELVLNAFRNGVETGRGGLGTIYVFATGNGGYFNDNCNYDGYTNSVYTISIGAIDRNNKHPPYSEQCSAHLTVTYSSSSSGAPGIKTTDIRPRNCTINHGGTSAAAPMYDDA